MSALVIPANNNVLWPRRVLPFGESH